jgi:sugar (pentulose or hexulose) kinase
VSHAGRDARDDATRAGGGTGDLARLGDLTDSTEAGALGTAMCAMVGAGLHDSVESAIRATVHDTDLLVPDEGAGREHLESGYEHYRRVIDALEGAWGPRGPATA